MKTVTLAAIYELQGLKEEALEIYKEILKQDPANHEARLAIHRLSGIRKCFKGVDKRWKEHFIAMQAPEEFDALEAWLAQLQG